MSTATPKLKATPREKTGTKYAQRLRKQGLLPVVVYGHKQDPAHIAISQEEFLHALHHGVHLLEVEHAGGSESCLIKEVQYDYLGTDVIHVDLTRVDLNEEIQVSVPLELFGEDECPGAKVEGAFIEQPFVDIEVICKANNIPDKIIVDISKLELGDAITIGDLKLPAGVTTEQNADDVVASVSVAKEVPEEEGAAAESAEPEVISERKDEGEGADKN
ncbi:MAG: 50S ribosomal protein L25 [Phycisphaera sp.]|nr:50S ribosomal protein L25 [Phycisphaera sp.]